MAFRPTRTGDVPDHTVPARFHKIHADAFAGLFTQVLRLCRAAGPARLRTVAVDGSKIAANASEQADRGPEWLRAEAEKRDAREAEQAAARPGAEHGGAEHGLWEVAGQILADAAEDDAAEDAMFGPAPG